MTLFK